MSDFERARHIYEEVIEDQPKTAYVLAEQLRARAEEERGKTRVDMVHSLNNPEPPSAGVAKHLETAASDVEEVFSGYSAQLSDLPDGVAGQAPLGGSSFEVDPESIQNETGRLVNKQVAEAICVHEREHNRQSTQADQESISFNGNEFDERQIREAAAISLQEETGFLSDEYKQIMTELPMNSEDRNLVRLGRFAELEREMNGGTEEESLEVAA